MIVRKENGVATLSLNRPPANSYHQEYLQLIVKTIAALEKEDSTKVVLINSTSEKFFCGGADIKVFSSNSREENEEMVVAARQVAAAITESSKIFIAAIAGHCLGGGLEIAMACDIRLASEGNYLIGLPEVKLGLMPGNGGTPRLIDLIGASRAMEMLVTGNSISPQQAYEIGLINQLYSKEEFEEKVSQYIQTLSAGPGKAMSAIKQYFRVHKGLNANQALDYETECVKSLYDTPDAIEGFKAFIEKRTPKFN